MTERLAQLPDKCGTCGGSGLIPTHQAHWKPCPTCHGKGVLYPPALVERIAQAIHGVIRLPNMGDSRRGETVELSWSGYREQLESAAIAVLDALNTEAL